MCSNQFFGRSCVSNRFFKNAKLNCAGVWGLVDQVFKPEIWKVDPVFKNIPGLKFCKKYDSFQRKKNFLKK